MHCSLTQHQKFSSRTTAPALPASGPVFLLEISVYMRRHLPLTRRTRGLDGSETDQLHITPTVADIDGDVELVQRIECSSEHTLQDLVDEFVCRNADIPEAIDLHPASCGSMTHWTSADDAGCTESASYTKYSSHPLVTDTCILINGSLYGSVASSSTNAGMASYVTALLSHSFPSDSPLHHAKDGGATLASVTFSSLSQLALHQPYWMLHVGDCEHVWIIDAIRYVLLGSHQHFIAQ